MAERTIYLVRHGRTALNAAGVPRVGAGPNTDPLLPDCGEVPQAHG
jgi:broad specificity phosphatase PhoE